MEDSDFVMTLDSDQEGSDSEELELDEESENIMSKNFSFEKEARKDAWSFENILSKAKNEGYSGSSIDDKIKKRLRSKESNKERSLETQEEKKNEEEESEAIESQGEEEEEEEEEEETPQAEDMEEVESEQSEKEEEVPQAKKAAEKKKYFASLPEGAASRASFLSMNLSRPLLKAITTLGYTKPTPIQACAIPVALMGKDVCGSAVTGTGKTAAFSLPILERLLHRPKSLAQTSVVVLSPTRELAVQVHSMMESLSQFTDITICLIVGGLSIKVQEAALRRRPDVIVATPGRLIDHIRNCPFFSLDTVEILVLDEADRLLEMGFQDEINEIVTHTPSSRQTMLFSATMTDRVDRLSKVSLRAPVRLASDARFDIAAKLTQEFVRIKTEGEAETLLEKEALLLALCTRTFKSKTVVFIESKIETHRMKIIFGLAGLSAAELHGNLTQAQRLEALEQFRQGAVDILLTTNLAARGLDIVGLETVINMAMPKIIKDYIHRVGRTARAGQGGRSVTLVGPKDRTALRELVKQSNVQGKNRIIAANIIKECKQTISDLSDDIEQILEEEKVERETRLAEMEAQKALNMMDHSDEIMARAPRTWFQSEKEKKAAKERQRDETDGMTETRDVAEALDTDANQRKKNPKSKKPEAKPKRAATAGLSRKKRRNLQNREESKAILQAMRKDGKKIVDVGKEIRLSTKAVKQSARSQKQLSGIRPARASAKPAKKKSTLTKGFDTDGRQGGGNAKPKPKKSAPSSFSKGAAAKPKGPKGKGKGASAKKYRRR